MTTFDFAVQVDVGFLLSKQGAQITPNLTKVYQVGEEFPAVFLPFVGDRLAVTEGFAPKVTTRIVGADLVLIQARGGPISDLPILEPTGRPEPSLKQRFIDALRADGYQ